MSISTNLIEEYESQLAALRKDVATSQELSATNILLDVVPGFDGMGEEVFAKSVAEVCEKLGDLALQAEELCSANSRLHDVATLCAEAEQRLADAERRNADMVELLHQAKQFTEDLLWPQRLRDRIDAVISHAESGSGEEKCSDCFGTGHAHSNGMCIDGTCDTCKGAGHE